MEYITIRMKNRLFFFIKYYIFWIVYFIILKIIFLLYNFHQSFSLNYKELFGIFLYGFKLDLSTAAYITAFSVLCIIILAFFKSSILKTVMKIATIFALVVTVIVAIIDFELYQYWGFRLDTTPLMYLNTPKEMFVSVSFLVILKQIIIGVLIFSVSFTLYKKFVEPSIVKIEKGTLIDIGIFLIIFALLIIPARGGLGLAPLNTGSAYFCHNQFANHAANNVVWNLGFSFTYYKESSKNPFKWIDEHKAETVLENLYKVEGKTKKVLNIERPNIILIIVESLTSKIIEPLGGLHNVAPNLNRYCQEGLTFSNLFANGNRSDKGLVAIFSGFPAQPIASIIKFPYKTETLPFFTKDLKRAGYYCSYYYGGDIDFAAMRSYMQNAGFDELICDKDFPASTYGAKWGVHDEYVFNRLFNDINKSTTPFFKAIFTISSHEPFDVPMKTVFKGNNDEQKFLNACYYTDSCIGNFIGQLKKSKYWKTSLVIITADHGAVHPGNTLYYDYLSFEIPMIWIGGAVNVHDSIVTRIGSQSDICNTVLSQLNIVPQKQFNYSKNLLDDSNTSFAFYTFNSGFGFVRDSCKIIYDNNSSSLLNNVGNCPQSIIDIGKSYQQVVYEEFLHR